MKESLKTLIAALLRKTADNIDAGNSYLTEEEAMDIMGVLTHQIMSKEDSCIYLNVSNSTFNRLIAEGKLPKGKKRRGFKELFYYKDELDDYLRREKALS